MLGARKHIHQRGRCRFKSDSIFPAKQAAEVAEPVLSSAKIGLFGSVSSSAVIRFLGRFVRVSTADRIYMWRIAQLAERQIVDLQDSGSEPDSPQSIYRRTFLIKHKTIKEKIVKIYLPSDTLNIIRDGLEWDGAILLKEQEPIAVTELGGSESGYFVTVTPEGIFVPALSLGADSIILAHSHPKSPFPIASREDIQITYMMMRIGVKLGISIIDHIIVTKERYLSFQETGMMDALKK